MPSFGSKIVIMIKPSELRIDNLVFGVNGKCIRTVTASLLKRMGLIKEKHCEPIPLTIDSGIHQKGDKFYSDPLYQKEIKYVHTLQNYYYFDVLTGEELVIK